MERLSEDCMYQYTVGNLVYRTNTFTFKGKTPDYSAPYDYDSPVTLLVLGDLGAGPVAQDTRTLMGAEADAGEIDAVVHLGDIAYNLNSNFGQVGDDFLREIQPIAARYPYMVVPGNHENSGNVTHYKARFKMPDNGDNEGSGYFYSFDIGAVHFILINTCIMRSEDQAESALTQWNWLNKDLAEAQLHRAERPWLVIGTHYPLYCSIDWLSEEPSKDCSSRAAEFQVILEELLNTNKVDLFLQAHVHNYERTAAIYHNLTVPSELDTPNVSVNPRAPIYITSGNAGNYEGYNDQVSRTPQDWSRARSQTYGYGRLTVHNKTHMYWEQVSTPYMEVVDYLWIVKGG
jgi:3',5'-cyclic AMP phosphodiesterase CpdA